jgi:hypothetical protein
MNIFEKLGRVRDRGRLIRVLDDYEMSIRKNLAS